MPASDLKALLAQVTSVLKERVDAASDDDAKKEARTDFMDEIRAEAPDVYNAIHGAASASARVAEGKNTQKVASKLKALEQELADTKEKLEAAETEKPDIAALTGKIEARAKKAEETLAAERADRQSTERSRVLNDATRGFEASLVEAGFRPRAAHGEVLRLKEAGLIKLTDDGAVEFYQLRDAGTTYPAPKNGGQPWEGLVKDVVKTADSVDLISNVDRGGGVGVGGSGTRGVPATQGAVPGSIDPRDPVVRRKLATSNYGGI